MVQTQRQFELIASHKLSRTISNFELRTQAAHEGFRRGACCPGQFRARRRMRRDRFHQPVGYVCPRYQHLCPRHQHNTTGRLCCVGASQGAYSVPLERSNGPAHHDKGLWSLSVFFATFLKYTRSLLYGAKKHPLSLLHLFEKSSSDKSPRDRRKSSSDKSPRDSA